MTVYKTAREEILKDWQANLQDFASEHEFPVEATESLQDALEIIGADDRLFPWWFRLKRFALGRLQFELTTFGSEYEKEGLILWRLWMEQTESPNIRWSFFLSSESADAPENFMRSRASAWRSSTIPWRICTGNFWSATKCMASGAPL